MSGCQSAVSLEGKRLALDDQAYTYAEYEDWYGQAALRCWLESPLVLQSTANLCAPGDAQERTISGIANPWEEFCAKHCPHIIKQVQQSLAHGLRPATRPSVTWVNSPRVRHESYPTRATETASPSASVAESSRGVAGQLPRLPANMHHEHSRSQNQPQLQTQQQ